MKKFEVGDRVRYSRKFCQSIGAYTGDIPFAKGVITEIKQYDQITIAVVDWGNEEIAPKCQIGCLVREEDVKHESV